MLIHSYFKIIEHFVKFFIEVQLLGVRQNCMHILKTITQNASAS